MRFYVNKTVRANKLIKNSILILQLTDKRKVCADSPYNLLLELFARSTCNYMELCLLVQT